MINNVNKELLDEFVELIYSRIKENFDKELNKANTEFYSEGLVESVDGDYATVKLSFCTTDLLPNLSGKSLSEGDKVKIYYNKNNMVGAYIGVAF